MAGVRSLIDLYPLSSYVDWAAKRNRDPILECVQAAFSAVRRRLELASAAARISTISRRISRTSGFNPPITTKTCSRRSGKCKPRAPPNVWTPSISTSPSRRPGRTPRRIATMSSSPSICFKSRPRDRGERDANRRAGPEGNRLPGDLRPFR